MLSYSDFRESVLNNNAKCVEQTRLFLDNIENHKNLNAFITVCPDTALKSAQESDLKFQLKQPRKLEGMLIALKDNISTKGIKTTSASRMLENFIPVYNATIVDKLINAGAIIIGKTNMDEFAMGSSGETSFFGPTLNPHNQDYVPGGSSSGSAVAVSANMAHASIGSDTGGSVRQPAAFCGVIGLKPTYGLISRYGLTAFASSLDTIGIIANNIEDTALILDVISGEDSHDATSLHKSSTNIYQNLTRSPSKYKIAILNDQILNHCTNDIRSAYVEFISKLIKSGCEVSVVDFPNFEHQIAIYQILSSAEASSNLARYDGVRYGFQANPDDDYEQSIINSRTLGFGKEVKRRIMLGTYVLSAGFYDLYYIKAQKARRLIFNYYDDLFKKYDFLILPTTPTAQFKIGELINSPTKMYKSDMFTVSANLAGIPSITLPVGYNENGFPIGMQIQTSHQLESQILNFSNYIINSF